MVKSQKFDYLFHIYVSGEKVGIFMGVLATSVKLQRSDCCFETEKFEFSYQTNW